MNKEREQAEALLEGEPRGYARVGNTEARKRDGIIEFEMPNHHPKGCACAICQAVEAVLDELERLRERNAALEEALRGIIARDWYDGDMRIAGPFAEIARAALDKK